MSWIEVKARCRRDTASVNEAYLVAAMSCTEAEARATQAIANACQEFAVTAVTKTAYAEVCADGDGDRYYKVRYALLEPSDKGADKRTPCTVLVQAYDLATAHAKFLRLMAPTLADYDLEQVALTKITDTFPYQPTAQ